MIPKVVLGAFLAALMVVVGVSSYLYLGTRQSKIAELPQNPVASRPAPFSLRGTLILSQDGALYSLSAGRFHQLTTRSGWMQPSFTPDGNLLVVRRSPFYSDIWTMTRYGKPIKQLTHNVASARSYDTGDNHWAFYPRATADGRTIFFSYDKPKGGYEVDLSVWSIPSNAGIGRGTNWTYSQGYTGGDIQPIPVSGGIIYTKYLRAADGTIHSQLWFVNRPSPSAYQLFAGRALTSDSQDCRSPAVSPDGHNIAMICTYGGQIANLVMAPFHGSSLGPMRTLISNQMVAQPTWAPDGSGIAYLAPAAAAAPFQLWFLPSKAYVQPAPSPSPSASAGASPAASPSPRPSPSPVVVNPIQITTNDGFDATSTLAWAS